MVTDREPHRECRADQPYDGGQGRWYHPAAQEVGEQEPGWPGGDIITLECPVCGHRFKQELPQ
jgi:hypothetical protein